MEQLITEQILQLGIGGALAIAVLKLVLEILKVTKKKNGDTDRFSELVDAMKENTSEVKRLGENHLSHVQKAIEAGNEQHGRQIELLGEIKGRLSK